MPKASKTALHVLLHVFGGIKWHVLEGVKLLFTSHAECVEDSLGHARHSLQTFPIRLVDGQISSVFDH